MISRLRFRIIAAIALFGCALQAVNAEPRIEHHSGPGWTYFRLGNPNDAHAITKPGTVFEGGGTDVKNAYQWMCRRGGNGDFLVIRATGTDAYNKYVQRLCPAINSVATLIIANSRGANQPFVRRTMKRAEALFIAGGDQSDYVKFWQKTPVNRAINRLAQNGVPVGGTSAGNAILAQFAYSALTGSITSDQALADPFDSRITIDKGFLRLSPLLRNRITDDHFVTRDRMGRLVAFLARIAQGNAGPRAIATDENAAFLMDASGTGRLVGNGTAYFVSAPGNPEVCEPGTPLTYKNLQVYKLAEGGAFDLRTWTGSGGTEYTVSAIDGVMSSSQADGSLY